ncbi:hypothetical protein [Streptomyces sp. NPDC005799]|uniref:hypothetical protein n=1 Tax=Streptomyces sp. NPDC005799 TaxID=3154678 RepID=UPI0033C7C5D4
MARDLPLGHVEVDLQSFDRTVPEEGNRIMADRLADLLLAPTAVAMATPRVTREQWAGPGGERRSPFRSGHPGQYLLAAVHRAGHHRPSGAAGRNGCRARRRPASRPAAGAPHPRLAARVRQFGIDLSGGSPQRSARCPTGK